ncbi:MAG: hypothetical protein H6835_06080 [Planctomycetes bacterium]|nr:hypothetical protein [Planctomycetota bacterium]
MNASPNTSAWSNADFEARLQQRLDERRDPLDDPQLVAWLDAHPERLAAFAGLRDDLRGLGAESPRPAAVPRRAARVALAAVAVVAVAGTAILGVVLRQPPPAAPAARSPGRVLTASLEGHPPRLYAAADFAVRESLTTTHWAGGAKLRLETYYLHHIAR